MENLISSLRLKKSNYVIWLFFQLLFSKWRHGERRLANEMNLQQFLGRKVEEKGGEEADHGNREKQPTVLAQHEG